MTYEEYLKKNEIFDYLQTLADMGIEYEVEHIEGCPGCVDITQYNGFRTIKTHWLNGEKTGKEYI